MDIASAAQAAENVINDVMKVEPTIATMAGMFVPGAAPVVATAQPFVMMAIPFVMRALDSIAQKNGGDAFGAVLELLNHISPGRPNSTILTAPLQQGQPAAVDPSKLGSG